MRFLIDAQLPRRLAHWLKTNGHDALHTMDLPTGNRTTDMEIGELSTRERRVLVTKDEDFVDTFVLRRTPHKLLMVSTGNTSNHERMTPTRGAAGSGDRSACSAARRALA